MVLLWVFVDVCWVILLCLWLLKVVVDLFEDLEVGKGLKIVFEVVYYFVYYLIDCVDMLISGIVDQFDVVEELVEVDECVSFDQYQLCILCCWLVGLWCYLVLQWDIYL